MRLKKTDLSFALRGYHLRILSFDLLSRSLSIDKMNFKVKAKHFSNAYPENRNYYYLNFIFKIFSNLIIIQYASAIHFISFK